MAKGLIIRSVEHLRGFMQAWYATTINVIAILLYPVSILRAHLGWVRRKNKGTFYQFLKRGLMHDNFRAIALKLLMKVLYSIRVHHSISLKN